MTSNRMDELFSRLENSSTTYADRATELSKMILEFEQRLYSVMKGKFAAFISREDSSRCVNLGYQRVGSGWRLCLSFGKGGDVWQPVQECSVERKILAVGLFEELLKEILGKQEAQTEELHKALDGITHFLAVETDREGGK